jgi:hypothetical protein
MDNMVNFETDQWEQSNFQYYLECLSIDC